MFILGILVGRLWEREEIRLFTEGIPTVCRITEWGKGSAPHSGYYANIEFIEDNQIKKSQQPISIDGLRNLNGDTYLCFVRSGHEHFEYLHAFFGIPVKLNGNSITIDLDRSWDNDSTTVEEAMEQ